ncbi:MAG: HD domain-containing protein [Oscillospiraceae bacterium]
MNEEFKRYVSNYNINDKAIKMKYNHSLRVQKLCKEIAEKTGYSENDIKIAEVIGLLHDYGRFPQWTEYKTFNDSESIDHADYSIEKLFYSGEIMKYWSNFRDYDEIFDGIKYHNKLKVPETLSEHNQNLCKVIRDADKIDIFYIYATGEYSYNEDTEEISKKIKSEFQSHNPIHHSNIKNGSDGIVYHLGYIYDLNFNSSFKYLKDNKLIDKIFEKIKDKEKFKPYFEEIKKYIDSKIKEDK